MRNPNLLPYETIVRATSGEPDSRKPTYIKIVIGVGYQFASGK